MYSDLHAQTFLHTVVEVLDLQEPIYTFEWEANTTSPREISGGGCSKSVSFLERGGWGGWEVDRFSDLSRLPFGDGAARTVLCLEILGHLVDPVRPMQEMQRIMAPGGLLVVVERAPPGEAASEEVPDPCWASQGDALAEQASLWRCTPAGLAHLLATFPVMLVAWQGRLSQPHTLYAVAKKAPLEESFWDRFGQLSRILSERFPTCPVQKAKKPEGWFRRLGDRWKRIKSQLLSLVKGAGPEREEFSMAYTFSLGIEEEALERFSPILVSRKLR